jgi:hypothetical protein
MKTWLFTTTCALVLLGATHPAQASVVTFTSEAAFVTAAGAGTVIDFDTDSGGNPIPDGAAISTQYSSEGVAFQPFNGGSPIARVLFPRSSPNDLQAVPTTAGGGGFEADFSPNVSAVGLWVGDLQGPDFGNSLFEVLDAHGASLGSFNLFDQVGDGSFKYLFFGVVSDTPIAALRVSVGALDYVTFDDLRFSNPVPEPGTLLLLASGGSVLMARRRKNRSGGAS